jgi:hypothetical protein
VKVRHPRGFAGQALRLPPTTPRPRCAFAVTVNLNVANLDVANIDVANLDIANGLRGFAG